MPSLTSQSLRSPVVRFLLLGIALGSLALGSANAYAGFNTVAGTGSIIRIYYPVREFQYSGTAGWLPLHDTPTTAYTLDGQPSSYAQMLPGDLVTITEDGFNLLTMDARTTPVQSASGWLYSKYVKQQLITPKLTDGTFPTLYLDTTTTITYNGKPTTLQFLPLRSQLSLTYRTHTVLTIVATGP